MKLKSFLSALIHKRSFRWYILAGVSFLISLGFATYNLVVGIVYRLVWNFSVSFYYVLLTAIKATILYRENKWKNLPEQEKQANRLTLFLVENVCLIIIDLALVAPIALQILHKKQAVDMGMIPTIAFAAYTTYRIIMSCFNYSFSQKTENLALHGIKVIGLKEAIASIITLQNVMVATFGNANEMQTLTAWTSIGLFMLMVIVSIAQFIKLGNRKKEKGTR